MADPVAPEITTFYAEATNPKQASTRSVHDQLRPIAKAGSAVRRQLAVHRENLLDAKLAEHDVALDPKLDRLENILKPLDTLVPQFLTICQAIGETFRQFDRVVAEDTDTLQRWSLEAQQPKTTESPAVPGVVETPVADTPATVE